jgi:hypothetical protein
MIKLNDFCTIFGQTLSKISSKTTSKGVWSGFWLHYSVANSKSPRVCQDLLETFAVAEKKFT